MFLWKGLERRTWNEFLLPCMLFGVSRVLKEGLEMGLFCSFVIPTNWGLERNSVCHSSNLCHGWWSWKELDLLCFLSCCLYMCCDCKLGSWNELGLVLWCSSWPMSDWGLDRGSWNELFLGFRPLPGSELLLCAAHVFPLMCFTLERLLAWMVSMVDTVLA